MPIGNTVLTALDLKMVRQAHKLLVRKWTWTSKPGAGGAKAVIEQSLGEFEAFQRR